MNIPNVISVFRGLMVPFIIIILFVDFTYHHYIALFLYIFAMASDLVDGYIARKYKLETPLGRFLDPLADKLISLSMIVTLVYLNIFPLWISLFIIYKDIIIDAVVNLNASLNIFVGAPIGGKLRTLFLSFAIIVGILALAAQDGLFIEGVEVESLKNVTYILLLISFFIGFYGMKKHESNFLGKIKEKWEEGK
ncbi:CDP-alcohol phosphatidyltransferase family protein [Patescibacteria group bacterium]